MKAEERARKIVGRLCTWIRPSDEEYIVAQIREAQSEQRERDAVIAYNYHPEIDPRKLGPGGYDKHSMKVAEAGMRVSIARAIRDDTS